MTPQEIHEKLDNMYNGTGSRNFINHMIRAYFPTNKVEKVWDTPKGKFKCAITNESLFSLNDVFTVINSEEAKNSFLENMKKMVIEPEKPIKAFDSALKEGLKNKKMGITGEKTDTYLSMPAYQEFFNWLTNKILHGDKHINWLIRQMQNDAMINSIESVVGEGDKDKIQTLRKVVKQPKTATLGDLDVLQQLKAKLEAEEKGN
jgi:hypothetical protein